MARDYQRTDRIGDQIQRDLAVLIRDELKDPRVGQVTVQAVKVSKDLGYADIYVSILSIEPLAAESQEAVETLKGLESASGFLRSELGKRMSMRIMPRLRFHYDEMLARTAKLDHLISKALKEDAKHGAHSDDSSSDDPTAG